VYDVVEARVSDAIMGALDDEILASLPGVGQPASLLLAGATTESAQLMVNLRFLTVPSVTIQVPYDAFDQNRSATLFAPDELLTLVASGLGMNDGAAGSEPPTTLHSGPNGVPLEGTTTWPKPRVVARTEPPPAAGRAVAQLTVRNTFNDQLRHRSYEYSAGCTVQAFGDPSQPGKAWLRFGVNDIPSDAQRLRGLAAQGYTLRLFFLSDDNDVFEANPKHCGGSGTNIWWSNAAGDLTVWLMNSGAIVGEQTIAPGNPTWHIQGTGDFDGNGLGDILWRDDNGQVAIHYMAGSEVAARGFPGGEDPSWYWKVQGVGDFDGDGRSDVLWRDANGQLAIWFKGEMEGAAFPGYSNVPWPVELAWEVTGVGDFDGDRRADILWRHTNGEVAIWNMDGGLRVGESLPGGQEAGPSWSIQGVGDFDGNGRSDILWRDGNGQLAIWFNGDAAVAGFPGYNNLPAPVDLAWQIQGVSDFDLDGRSDILWRSNEGQVALWIMNGAQFLGDMYPRQMPNSWQIEVLARDSR
jgi:hypothetical protein